jgi:proton glutamate symport protein
VGGLGAHVIGVFRVALTVAPVPSASVVTLAPALDAMGVPAAGLAILFGIDRIPDMFRSTVNITGHMVWAVVVEELAFGRRGPGGSREGEGEDGKG